MRASGVAAAFGLVGLEDWRERALMDNANGKFLAEGLASIPGIIMDPSVCETNIVRWSVEPEIMKSLDLDFYKLSAYLRQNHKLLANAALENDHLRFVTHSDVTREDCERVLDIIKKVFT